MLIQLMNICYFPILKPGGAINMGVPIFISLFIFLLVIPQFFFGTGKAILYIYN